MTPDPQKFPSHKPRGARQPFPPRVRPAASVVHGESVYRFEVAWVDQSGVPRSILCEDYATTETIVHMLELRRHGALFCLGTPSVQTIEAMIDVSDTLLAATLLRGALGDEV